MNERYQRLFTAPENLYQESSPVLLSAGALLKDNVTGNVLAQLKFSNISPKIIKALTVSIQPMNVKEEPLGDPVSHQYLDLNQERNSDFGSRIPIPLPDASTRSFRAWVTEVVYEDLSVWKSQNQQWTELEGTDCLGEVWDAELLRQAEEEYDFYPRYQFKDFKDLWYCGCGALNRREEECCSQCGASADMQRNMDLIVLQQHRDERLRREQIAAEEARQEAEIRRKEQQRLREEKLAETRKKAKKISIIVVIAALILGAVFSFVKFGIPLIQNQMAYSSAAKLAEAGSYDKAMMIYRDLKDFRDSKTMVTEMKYRKACSVMEAGNYEEAIKQFRSILSYKDAKTKISACEEGILQLQYEEAEKLQKSGEYAKAITAFQRLKNFKDSEEKVLQCQNAIKQDQYDAALQKKKNKDYSGAAQMFRNLKDFSDAKEQYRECYYLEACVYLDKQDYSRAITFFERSEGYQDAKEKIKTTAYAYGTEQLQKKSYGTAISAFEKCRGYEDAHTLMLQAKYGYVSRKNAGSDKITIRYLRDLMRENYKDSKSIYERVIKWKATIYAINSDENSSVNQDRVSKYNKWYFHIRLSGGPEGGSINPSYCVIYPDGSRSAKREFGYAYRSGDTVWVNAWWKNPYDAPSGTSKIIIYDEKGQQIGSGSVRVS